MTIVPEMTDEELDHERACCERFTKAQKNYFRVCEDEPDAWLKANAALEELWAAYQDSPCACAEKPEAAKPEPSTCPFEAALDELAAAHAAVRELGAERCQAIERFLHEYTKVADKPSKAVN